MKPDELLDALAGAIVDGGWKSPGDCGAGLPGAPNDIAGDVGSGGAV